MILAHANFICFVIRVSILLWLSERHLLINQEFLQHMQDLEHFQEEFLQVCIGSIGSCTCSCVHKGHYITRLCNTIHSHPTMIEHSLF